jgi:hypothetical protein
METPTMRTLPKWEEERIWWDNFVNNNGTSNVQNSVKTREEHNTKMEFYFIEDKIDEATYN